MRVILNSDKTVEKHGVRTYTINQDGISFFSSELQASMKWSNISKFVQTKRYIYLYINADSAYVFPLRTISEEQLKEFIGYIPLTVKKK
ncbi:YcxB family protein [Bacillus sp. BRMEA1]|uniref:YcxB family protein n=1 Tax=Neobacillus endophyticus TaxID=2738405 RepID=UPI0015651CA0|nr:YcxB family protein [Neobacillus endophyticus]NRD81066.1 YcxB family protein [Neobacillus endophyticus]